MLKFYALTSGQNIYIPKELIYLYALYIYPLLLLLALFKPSRILEILLSLVIIVPLLILVSLFTWDVLSYMGWGLYLGALLSVLLGIRSIVALFKR